jgi:hypothetical protein
MIHEILMPGETVKETFASTLFITNKRLIKTNMKTYFEDLDLDVIEGVEIRITHYELILRVASSFLILYTLFLLLGSIELLTFITIDFNTNIISFVCNLLFCIKTSN